MDEDNLKDNLLELYENQEKYLKDNYDRSLSFQDGFFDRFKRAARLGFGADASIYNSALVYGKVTVGVKTWIGPNVILDGSGGDITIGDYCSISAAVHIYTHDSVLWALSGGKKQVSRSEVLIGDCTYVGAQSIIKAGIRIGSHCVVGANSFVNREVQDYAIVAGSPARCIGRVVKDEENISLEYF